MRDLRGTSRAPPSIGEVAEPLDQDPLPGILDWYARRGARFSARHADQSPELAQVAARLSGRLAPGARILDLGCGAGRDMAAFEAAGFEVTGVDASEAMLSLARPRVRGPLEAMDMRALRLPDAGWDGVWCMAALLHLRRSDAPAALAEMRRVLRPGGWASISVLEGRGERLEPDPEPGVPGRFFTDYQPGELEDLLEDAGLIVELVSRRTGSSVVWLDALAHRPGGERATGGQEALNTRSKASGRRTLPK